MGNRAIKSKLKDGVDKFIEDRRRTMSKIKITLSRQDSEGSISEYIENLKKQEVSFTELTERINRIIIHVQKKVSYSFNNIILLQKINNCLKNVNENYSKNKNNPCSVNALLNDLIQSLLFADLMYHPGIQAPDKEESPDEKEMREYRNDESRWIPTSTMMNIRQKSSAASQNKNLKDVLMIMIKTIEDDLQFLNENDPQITRKLAAIHIEKIMGPS